MEVEEIRLELDGPQSDKIYWKAAIEDQLKKDHSEAWYMDGSMAEDGNVGAGWNNVKTEVEAMDGSEALGMIATVWDAYGEICGMRGALEAAGLEARLQGKGERRERGT